MTEKNQHGELTFKDCPVYVRREAGQTMFFLPKGSRTKNLQTGEVVELAPGYYVNPKQLGVITNVKSQQFAALALSKERP